MLLAQGAVDAAEVCFATSQQLYTQLGSPSAQTVADYHLGMVAHYRGDLALAAARYARSLEASMACADPSGCIDALLMQALLAHEQGDFARAAALLLEAQAQAEPIAYHEGIARAAYLAGLLALEQGQGRQAAYWLHHSPARDAGAGTLLAGLDTLDAIVVWGARYGAWEPAGHLAGAAAAFRAETGAMRWPATDQRLVAPLLKTLRSQRPAADWARCWSAGQALPVAAAMTLALQVLAPGAAAGMDAMPARPAHGSAAAPDVARVVKALSVPRRPPAGPAGLRAGWPHPEDPPWDCRRRGRARPASKPRWPPAPPPPRPPAWVIMTLR